MVTALQPLPNELCLEEDHKAEDEHIPVVLAIVLHYVEGFGHMTVAIITEQIMNAMAVNLGGFSDTKVPACHATQRKHFKIINLSEIRILNSLTTQWYLWI